MQRGFEKSPIFNNRDFLGLFSNFRLLFRLPTADPDIPLSEVEFFALNLSRSCVLAWYWIVCWLLGLEIFQLNIFSPLHLIFPFSLLICIFLSTHFYFRSHESSNLAHLFTIESLLVLFVPLIFPKLFAPHVFPYSFVVLVLGILSASNLDFWESITSIFLLALVYGYVLAHNFAAIDYGNSKVFHGEFALLWTIGIPVAMIYVRRRLLFSVIDIDKYNELFVQEEHVRLAKINVANQSDPLNIAIHGTILNTFLMMTKNFEFNLPKEIFVEQLEKDFLQIQRARSGQSGTLRDEINNAISQIPNRQLNLDLRVVEHALTHNIYRSLIVEICREKVLNLSKCSKAVSVRLEVVLEKNDIVNISFISEFEHGLDRKQLQSEMKGQQSSNTISRLLKSVGSRQVISSSSNQVVQVFTIDPQDLEKKNRNRVKSTRFSGIEALGRFLMGVTGLYGFAIIPGLYILNVSHVAIGLLLLISVTNSLSAIFQKYMALTSWINSILGIIAFLVCREVTPMCTHFAIRHWLYCALIGTFGGAALTVQHKIARWIPMGLLILTGIAGIQAIPAVCHINAISDTPGLILILLAALMYSALRHESLAQHRQVLTSIVSSSKYRQTLSDALETRRDAVISRAFSFFDLMKSSELPWEELVRKAKLEHDRIRAFILSSPHFDIPFHLEIFDLLMKRIDQEKISVLEIIGNPPNTLRTYFGYRKVINSYQDLFDLPKIHLTIYYTQLPTLLVEVPIEVYEKIKHQTFPEAEVFLVKIEPIDY